jgi:two-component system response regulator NreC
MPIKLLIADDHPLIAEGIKKIFEGLDDFSIIATVGNGKQALSVIEKQPVDIALLDINMPEMDGIECAKKIIAYHPFIKVVMLSMYQEASITKKLMQLGVKGYMLKTISSDELIMALNIIYKGKEYFNLEVTKNLFANNNSESFKPLPNQSLQIYQLTDREKEIVTFISKGLTNNQIGEKLHISGRTVDSHRTNIMKKLDLHNVASLIRFAFQNGLAS